MANAIIPVVGQWYRHLDKGESFQVIDFNGSGDPVQVQFFDGDIESIPRDEWHVLPIEACAPPEDWTGPYDDVKRDDLGYSETLMSARDWRESVEGMPPQPEAWQDTTPADGRGQPDEDRPEEPFASEQAEAGHRLG